MKILNFIVCMMLPVYIMTNAHTMENTGYQNPIFRIVGGEGSDFANNLLSSTYFNMNNAPKSEDIDIGRLRLDSNPSDSSNSNNIHNYDIKSERQGFGKPHSNFINNQKNNNVSELNISNFKIDIDAEYEKLISKVIEFSRLTSPNMNSNISTQSIIAIINNIFDDMNNNNKVINIVSLKQICDKYDNSNTIFNKIKGNNAFIEHKVIKLIEDLANKFLKYIHLKKEVDNIDKITKELTNKINSAIDKIITSNGKYGAAKAKVIIDNDLDKRNKLEQESEEIKQKYNNDKYKMLNILKLKNNVTNENFIKNILKEVYKSGKFEVTTLYEILNNDNYVADYNIADDIYNNIISKDLEHSHNVCKCLENILEIKEKLKQMWNNFKNNERNKINNKNDENEINNENELDDNNKNQFYKRGSGDNIINFSDQSHISLESVNYFEKDNEKSYINLNIHNNEDNEFEKYFSSLNDVKYNENNKSKYSENNKIYNKNAFDSQDNKNNKNNEDSDDDFEKSYISLNNISYCESQYNKK